MGAVCVFERNSTASGGHVPLCRSQRLRPITLAIELRRPDTFKPSFLAMPRHTTAGPSMHSFVIGMQRDRNKNAGGAGISIRELCEMWQRPEMHTILRLIRLPVGATPEELLARCSHVVRAGGARVLWRMSGTTSDRTREAIA